jgi:hypothetical protein
LISIPLVDVKKGKGVMVKGCTLKWLMFVSNCVPPLVKRYYSVFPFEIEQKRAYTLFRFNSCVSSFCPSYIIVFLVLVSLLNTIHVWMNNFKANSKSNSKGYKSTLCFYFWHWEWDY